MAVQTSPLTWLMLFCFTLGLLVCCHGASDDRQAINFFSLGLLFDFVYIVYMGDIPKGDFSAANLHTSMLQDVVPSPAASDVLLYSYHRSFNGFAAKLTKDEAEKLRGKEGVVSVFLSQKKQLHTSWSWDFMGFSKKVKRSVIESDIIVGMLDTGIWPESESFNDTGFGPIPAKWKGTCQKSSNFTCNKKIIAAKYYRANGDFSPGDFISPRDSEGHGSHTASTAAGGLASRASLYGLAKGTVRGAVPSARIAVYKICWSDGCYDVDILAAFDDAIADGVDIISLSVGSFFSSDYFDDSIAIGAFHSMKNGVLTSNSAGNSGPRPASIVNFSPWSLSVAASTIDRKFVTKVKLGNGEIYEGTSINTFDLKEKMYPFIFGGVAPNTSQGFTSEDSRYCLPGTLNETLVKGKIVFCDYDSDGDGPIEGGAVGAVFQYGGKKDYVFSYPLPLSNLNLDDGRFVLNYVNTTENPTATIFKSDVESNEFAPYVVSFSSRGPNPVTADILKPDLTAPGVDILAAWSEAAHVTESEYDNRIVPYNIISGTSMSCPHATGAAAYVKSFHPTWSPAAIKSALMTTAFQMSAKNNIEGEFAFGAGHINPALAAQPGLIYDAGEIEYIKFLCGQGYSPTYLQLITGNNSSCSEETNGTVWDLNYPSFALSATPGKSITRAFHRTVTNVGSAVSTYKAVVKAPPGLIIQVQPSVLSFKSLGQKQSFVVTVGAEVGNSMISGSLTWDDGLYQVRSPIVAYASLIE
ncbi:Subtilisin-like serine endopeptidase family protein [Theobroma cacao]|uniref:Subtilisin-like serine endopeptidase family protein n=1 Tax=Theobroma cacao TaxID=3641 RepID=A0A061FLJ4_THECC|nr:Subtilisin-like serine endopeptidase family protein [Theobroma cacao]